ncbi:MAG TPA: hypothetical protein PK313_15640 [Myxococcota bacterium]|nr:hypothetical protein [Myxococcota bacterium]
MQFTFIGHVSKDIDTVTGVRREALGGGVFHGAITASRLGVPSRVLTRAAPTEAERARHALGEAGVGALATAYEDTPYTIKEDGKVLGQMRGSSVWLGEESGAGIVRQIDIATDTQTA